MGKRSGEVVKVNLCSHFYIYVYHMGTENAQRTKYRAWLYLFFSVCMYV